MQHHDLERTVRLEGPLTVVGAEALKARLMEAFTNVKCLKIDVSGAKDIDVSALQILLAARKMADATGKTMVVLPNDRLKHELDRFGIPLGAISNQETASL